MKTITLTALILLTACSISADAKYNNYVRYYDGTVLFENVPENSFKDLNTVDFWKKETGPNDFTVTAKAKTGELLFVDTLKNGKLTEVKYFDHIFKEAIFLRSFEYDNQNRLKTVITKTLGRYREDEPYDTDRVDFEYNFLGNVSFKEVITFKDEFKTYHTKVLELTGETDQKLQLLVQRVFVNLRGTPQLWETKFSYSINPKIVEAKLTIEKTWISTERTFYDDLDNVLKIEREYFQSEQEGLPKVQVIKRLQEFEKPIGHQLIFADITPYEKDRVNYGVGSSIYSASKNLEDNELRENTNFNLRFSYYPFPEPNVFTDNLILSANFVDYNEQ